MITRQEVAHVARLARLKLSAKEETAMTSQLAKMLDYFNLLREVDTEGIAPIVHVVEHPNAMREDIPKASLTADEVLANAPASATSESNFFTVPKVVDKTGT